MTHKVFFIFRINQKRYTTKARLAENDRTAKDQSSGVPVTAAAFACQKPKKPLKRIEATIKTM